MHSSDSDETGGKTIMLCISVPNWPFFNEIVANCTQVRTIFFSAIIFKIFFLQPIDRIDFSSAIIYWNSQYFLSTDWWNSQFFSMVVCPFFFNFFSRNRQTQLMIFWWFDEILAFLCELLTKFNFLHDCLSKFGIYFPQPFDEIDFFSCYH